jgi:hypothetical protein
MDGGDGREPLEERRGRLGAATGPAIDGIGAGGHDLEFLDERRVDGEGHLQRGHRLGRTGRRAVGKALDHREGTVQPPLGAHRIGQSVVPEAP